MIHPFDLDAFLLDYQSQVLHMHLSCSGASESIIHRFHSWT